MTQSSYDEGHMQQGLWVGGYHLILVKKNAATGSCGVDIETG